MKTLDNLTFDNRFVNALPADPIDDNFCRQVSGACYSRVQPTAVANGSLVAYATEVAQLLDLSRATCESPLFTQLFSGNQQVAGMDPYAMCYGGHQFGHWAGQLGDGRAINLGEVINTSGERWILQLKGAGRTPYSRTADGLAVLRSSVREFLCSEAMFHLGVPTTRALSLVLTGEEVMRDMFYDGNPKNELGAIVCRVAPSFIRFGNFEIFASRGENALLQQLVDYTIRTDFPNITFSGTASTEIMLKWFEEICQTTLTMIIHWQRVGFVHGVMNTDNMSILGLTIDYGPYGWLEDYDPNWTPNTTDAQGRRYCFGNQPQIALWNLTQLAQTLLQLINEVAPIQAILDNYWPTFETKWHTMMAEKLGLKRFAPESDTTLISELQTILQLTETDMTIFFRHLALIDIKTEDLSTVTNTTLMAPIKDAYYTHDTLTTEVVDQISGWLRKYISRLSKDGLSWQVRQENMDKVNPKYVLRNYLAHLAIEQAEKGDFTKISEMLEVVRTPYTDQPGKEAYGHKRPDWARHKSGCSMLSCSS